MSYPLYVETYSIGKRTYRKNPYKHGAGYKLQCDVGDTPDLYPEEDEAEDGPSCAFVPHEEVNCDNIATEEEAITIEEKTETILPEGVCLEEFSITFVNNAWISEVDVPSFVYGRIIGIRGSTLRELEDSTGCRIIIPRKGSKEKFITVRSKKGKENVQRCVEQIMLIAEEARKNARPTHFTAYPCTYSEILDNFNTFRETVLTSGNYSESIKHESLFAKPSRLHLTITMLYCQEISDTVKATLVMKEIGKEIRETFGDKKIVADIQGISIMNDDPSSVDVLYANAHGEELQEAANIVYRHMVAAHLSNEVETGVSTTAHPVKLHMTLLNSRLKAEITNKKRKSFDASEVMKELKDFYFGTVVIDKISICKLSGAKGEEDSYYEELCTISI